MEIFAGGKGGVPIKAGKMRTKDRLIDEILKKIRWYDEVLIEDGQFITIWFGWGRVDVIFNVRKSSRNILCSIVPPDG